MAQALTRTGRNGALVNNAGVMHTGVVEETTIEEARAVLETTSWDILA